MKHHILEQIGLGIGFLAGIAGFFMILYARISRKRSEGILHLPDEQSARKENVGLLTIIIGTVICLGTVWLARSW